MLERFAGLPDIEDSKLQADDVALTLLEPVKPKHLASTDCFVLASKSLGA